MTSLGTEADLKDLITIHMRIYVLFNDAAGISEYSASNGGTINEYWRVRKLTEMIVDAFQLPHRNCPAGVGHNHEAP